MSNDRLPVPIQAVMATFVPGMFAAAYLVVWAVANWSEPAPGETRSPALLLIPIVMLLTGVWVQYRFVRRAVLINLLDRTASPVAITALTVFGAVIAVALMNYWPSTPLSGPQTPWNRYRIGFEDFVALLVIWLAAIAGLLIGRRRQT